MIIRFSCILFLAISGVSFSDAQRAFAGGFDGADFLNVNNAGNEPTLRGFDPNMRIPRFQNRRLGELPRPLQIEVINALIANGVRGSRVNNGFTAGVGGANSAAINTRRFTVNGAQGRTFGVDALTATGMNGGGVAGRRFTVNNRFGDSLSTTRIGRIPPPGTGGQTIDLAATRATGRIGGRPAVRTTTRITGGMPRSGILGGLGGNVDDLFLDPVSGRRVLVRPIGVANNLVNQRTNGDGGIGGGFTDTAGGNGFRRLPTSTFAGGPQTNIRRSQLPIFPPGGMAGTIRNTNFNRGFPNDRVSPFPFSGMQTDMISNNVAPQPIALSSLEPFSENFMARQPFNFPPPGFDAGRPRVPPARPPPGLGSLPGPESPTVPGITFPLQPPVDVNPSTASGTSVGSRSTQFPRSRSSGSTAFGQTNSQNLRTLNFQPVRGTMSHTFQRNPQPQIQRNPEPLIRSGNASIDVQVDDFLSSLDALIAAEESAQGLANTQNSQATSRSSNTNNGANIFSNDFTLPTSLPDPAFQRNNQRSSRPLNSQTNSFLWAGNTLQNIPSVSGNNNTSATSSVSHSTSVMDRNSGISTSGISSMDSTGRTNTRLVLARGTIQDNTGTNVINTAFSANNQQLNSFSPATQNFNSATQTFNANAANSQQISNTAFPSQSPQDLRRGAMNSIQTLITSGAADSSGFFLEGQSPQQGSTIIQGDSFIDWSHFSKALQDHGFGDISPVRTDLSGNVINTASSSASTQAA